MRLSSFLQIVILSSALTCSTLSFAAAITYNESYNIKIPHFSVTLDNMKRDIDIEATWTFKNNPTPNDYIDSNLVISEIKSRDIVGQTAARFLVHMDDRVVNEGEAVATFNHRGMIHVVKEIINDGPFAVLPGGVHAAGDGAGSIDGLVGAVGITMNMHEDVAFNPRIGAVEVEIIIPCPIEHVADDLEDGPGTVAAGEVDGVIEAEGVAEIIIAEDAVTARSDAVDAM